MNEIYTYQGGKKLLLARDDSYLLSRASKSLIEEHFAERQRISRHCWKVRSNGNVDDDIRRLRELDPACAAYPAYVMRGSGRPLNVTDRIFVRFQPGVEIGRAHV